MASVDCEALRAIELPLLNESYRLPEERPIGTLVDTVIFWFGVACILLGLVVFALAKYVLVPRSSGYYRYLSVRFFPAVVMVHVGGLLSLICGSLAVLVPYNTFPCWMTMTVLFVPAFLAVPPAVRYFTFYRQHQISRAAAESAGFLQQQKAGRRGSLASMIELDEEDDEPLSCRVLLLAMLCPTKLSIEQASGSVRFADAPPGGSLTEDQESRSDVVKDFLAVVKILKLLSSSRSLLIAFAVCLIPYGILFMAALVSSPFARSGCNTCTLASIPLTRSLLYVGSAVPLVICGLSFLLVRKIPDTLYIVREIRFAFTFFLMPAAIFLIVSSFTFRNTDFSLRFFYQLCILGFCLCQSLVPACLVLQRHFSDARRVRRTSRVGDAGLYQGKTTAMDIVEFEHVLSDPVLHDAFMDHLMTEHSVESLRFHDEVQKWVKQFHDINQRTAQVRAKKIVSLFVGDDAVFPVNLPSATISSLRASVGVSSQVGKKSNVSFKRTAAAMQQQLAMPEEEILREVDQHFFDEADYQIKELMRMDAFSRFQKTRRYKDLKSVQLGMKSSFRRTGHDSVTVASTTSERGMA